MSPRPSDETKNKGTTPGSTAATSEPQSTKGMAESFGPCGEGRSGSLPVRSEPTNLPPQGTTNQPSLPTKYEPVVEDPLQAFVDLVNLYDAFFSSPLGDCVFWVTFFTSLVFNFVIDGGRMYAKIFVALSDPRALRRDIVFVTTSPWQAFQKDPVYSFWLLFFLFYLPFFPFVLFLWNFLPWGVACAVSIC